MTTSKEGDKMEITRKITFSLTEEEKEAFVTVNTVLENLSKELRRMDGNKALLLNCDRDFTKITADEIDSITKRLDWFPDADIYTEKLEKRYWQIPFFCYTIIVRREVIKCLSLFSMRKIIVCHQTVLITCG